MAKVWDKPITADTDWGGDASTENLPVSGRQVQAWIKSNIKSDAQISQLLVSWLNENTINSPEFWKGLPIDADTLKWENNTLTVIGSDGETEAVIDEEFLINFLKEYGYITKRDYPFVYDAEKKVWLFTGDLITTGAVTMFGSIEGFNPSTIMDAVQVDGRTIVKNAAGQLVAIGGGGSGGGLVVDDVNALIEAALVPVQEEIGLKWTEDSDSIYRWNLAFSWGDHSKKGYALRSYVDDELTKYILLDTAQGVNAQHNFKKGLFIGGLPITKVNSNTIFLDANLVIGGAITMFGNNSSTFKAIWENIPFNPEHMTWDGSQWNILGGGSGSVDDAKVNVLIGEYLDKERYATQDWVQGQGYATKSWVAGKKYLTGITSAQVTTALGYTPYDSNNPDKYIKGIDYDMVIAALGYTPYSTTNPMGYLTIISLNGYATEQWVSNQGFAKQSSLDGVDNRLKSVETFFATSDTDSLVNKWSEIVTFLNATEGDTLDNILKTKANQSALDAAVASLTTEIGKKWTQNDAKIANWDSAYNWGDHANAGYAAETYVDGELTKHVKLATAQIIYARHNFSDGLQIGGITIRKSQDGTLFIDGNVVISGAFTMFGTGSTTSPTIWENIPFDLSTMEWTGSVWRVKGEGSSSVDDAKVNVLIGEYLDKERYATQDWVQGQGYLTTHQSLSHLLTKIEAANTYQPIINGSNKLAYSFISDTPDLSVYFRSSDFTKVNIKSTLGISDWALASTRPSYSAADVGALSTSGGTINGTSNTAYIQLRLNSDKISTIEFLQYNISKGVIGWYGMTGIRMQNANGYGISIKDDNTPMLYHSDGAVQYELLHANNIGSYKAGDSYKLGGYSYLNYARFTDGGGYISFNLDDSSLGAKGQGDGYIEYYDFGEWYNSVWGKVMAVNGFIGNLTGNADSATKLAPYTHNSGVKTLIYGVRTDNTLERCIYDLGNALYYKSGKQGVDAEIATVDSNVKSATQLKTKQTIWGQPFDGTENIYKSLFLGDKQSSLYDSWQDHIGLCVASTGLYGWVAEFGDGKSGIILGSRNGTPIIGAIESGDISIVPDGGNIAIGGTAASAKFHVFGDAIFTDAISTPQINIGGLAINKSQDQTLFIDANVVVRGAITMFGMNTTTVMGDLEERLSILERKVNQLTA